LQRTDDVPEERDVHATTHADPRAADFHDHLGESWLRTPP
jgi:hypothetical protein